MNASQTYAIGDISIRPTSIEPSRNTAYFIVTGTRINTPWIVLDNRTGGRCVKGICSSTPTVNSSGDIYISLTSVSQINRGETTTSTNTSASGDSPVSAYVYVNKEIPLIKNDVATVDVQKTRTETGVTYSNTTSEVNVYFNRNQELPISIDIKAESRPPKNEEWTSKRVKYTIDSSGTYTFTVRYKKLNSWGAESDVTETYGLKLINLGDPSAGTQTVAAKGVYNVYIPDSITITMTQPGTFASQSGVTVTPLSGTEYRFSFNAPGTYRMKYTTAGGQVIDNAAEFNVKTTPGGSGEQQSQESASKTATGNQQQGEDDNLFFYLLMGILAAGALVIIITKRKKSHGDYRIYPKASQ
jgi:hypothetical protein